MVKKANNLRRQNDNQLLDTGWENFKFKILPEGSPVRIYEEDDLYDI